jgi:hypothetical protein
VVRWCALHRCAARPGGLGERSRVGFASFAFVAHSCAVCFCVCRRVGWRSLWCGRGCVCAGGAGEGGGGCGG